MKEKQRQRLIARSTRYRRDDEDRLDDASAEWKRSVFVSLFEPWIIDPLEADAARKLAKSAAAPGEASSG